MYSKIAVLIVLEHGKKVFCRVDMEPFVSKGSKMHILTCCSELHSK